VKGNAYKADPSSDEAKLKVKFYLPPSNPTFTVVGDYWVLYLDADYHYAIVGEPSRTSLFVCNLLVGFSFLFLFSFTFVGQLVGLFLFFLFWQILSRQNHIDDKIYNQLVQKAVDEGYDVSKLRKTPPSKTPPPQ